MNEKRSDIATSSGSRDDDSKSLLLWNEREIGREMEIIKSIESTRDTSHITHFAYSTRYVHCTFIMTMCVISLFAAAAAAVVVAHNHFYAQLCYKQFIKSSEQSESVMEAEEKTKQTNCNYNRAMTVKWRKVCAQNIFSFSPHTRTHNKEMSVIYRLLLSFLKGKNYSPNHFPDDDVYEAKEVRHTHTNVYVQ